MILPNRQEGDFLARLVCTAFTRHPRGPTRVRAAGLEEAWDEYRPLMRNLLEGKGRRQSRR